MPPFPLFTTSVFLATLCTFSTQGANLLPPKIDDNLVNKPEASLQAVFRSWMPQTAASVVDPTMTTTPVAVPLPRWGMSLRDGTTLSH